MSVHIGPTIYGPSEPDFDRYITADEPPQDEQPSNVISVVGDLDMKQNRIINLRQSGQERSDAATIGYVSDWIGRLNNTKVDWNGGTMTGDLNMGNYKLKQPGDPEDDDDVINKRYFDQTVQETKPYDLGRYIVFPHADGTSTYHGAGSKKNIDIDDGKLFEIFNGNVHGQELLRSPAGSLIDIRTIKLPGNEKSFTILRSMHLPSLNPPYPTPWTVIISMQPNAQPNLSEQIDILTDNDVIRISWDLNSFIYEYSHGNERVMFNVDTNLINHFVFRYDGNSLVVWANGVSRKTHNNFAFPLDGLREVWLRRNIFGIVSIYGRDLSKLEVVEHYVKYHVKAFTNDEVL